MAILSRTEIRAEMADRLITLADNTTAYAAFTTVAGSGVAGFIEQFGSAIEDNQNWFTLTEDQQALWMAIKREINLSTDRTDFLAAVDAVQAIMAARPDI